MTGANGQHPDPVRLRSERHIAFFDLALSGRWGALITGDRGELTIGRCACGRRCATIADSVIRYIDLPEGDDKVSCAGTVDAYVQGLIGG